MINQDTVRQLTEMTEALMKVERCIPLMIDADDSLKTVAGREMALARTKVEEAFMWLERAKEKGFVEP